jgi:6,7-dimethyl-8-ribityllumazine synthase
MTNEIKSSSIRSDLSGKGLRIGIVQSRFNPEIGNVLLSACMDELKQAELSEADIVLFTVPGALEIPLTLTELAENDRLDALIALGCVIRGETYHFELVCNESARAITEMQFYYRLPVVNAILTTETQSQALSRAPVKGREAAQVAVEMAHVMRQIRMLSEKQHQHCN